MHRGCIGGTEAFSYDVHGEIALEEETEEGARRALVYFETKCRCMKQLAMMRVSQMQREI